eukprot:679275-Hanusia_phi.AAC.1
MDLSPDAVLKPYTVYSIQFKLKSTYNNVTTKFYVESFSQLHSAIHRPEDCLSQSDECTGMEMTTSVTSTALNQRMGVCGPQLVSGTIQQSFSWPGCGGPSSSSYEQASFVEGKYDHSTFLVDQRQLYNAHNTFTLKFTPNVDIPSAAMVTLKNLHGIVQISSTSVGLYHQVNENTTQFNTLDSAINSTHRHVVFMLNNNVSAYEEFTLAFNVTNNVERSDPQSISISMAWEVDGQQILITETVLKNPAALTANDLLDVVDFQASRVISPAWIIRKIKQSTPFPNANNTISVELAANVEFRKGAKISIRGL